MDLITCVYNEVKKIPCGKTSTYKQIGLTCGIHPRYVGYILHKNPDPVHIPCHRVIRSNGTLSSGYAFGGKEVQRRKLESEGVVI